MRIAIVGTGGAALATAALLCQRNHDVTLISITGKGGEEFIGGKLTSTGAITGCFHVTLAANVRSAFENNAHIVLATSADRYSQVIDKIYKYVGDHHKILISGELTQISTVLYKQLKEIGKSPSICALSTTMITGRRETNASVKVGLVRSSSPAISFGQINQGILFKFWKKLSGIELIPCASSVQLTLSNLNPIVHVPNAICNFTRVELEEQWSNFGGITPGVAQLIEALDRERTNLANFFGYELVSFKENFRAQWGFKSSCTLFDMAAQVNYRRGGLPKGPTSVDTRYITEDIPFGLVVFERLGQINSIDTSITSATISIASAIYSRDFRSANPFLNSFELCVI